MSQLQTSSRAYNARGKGGKPVPAKPATTCGASRTPRSYLTDAQFAEAYMRLKPTMDAWTFARTRDHVAKEDLVNETFMKSYAYAARQRIEDLHAFLWRVLRNETTSFLRRVRFEPSIDRPVSATDGRTLANTLPDLRAAVPEEIAIRAEVGREVRVVLGKMPSRDQQILKMYYWDHLTDAEIAVKLALTRERVGQIRRGALNRMKEALKESRS